MRNSTIKLCFDRAAKTYDAYSSVQQLVGIKLIDMLQQQQTRFANVIDLGCGTGITTQVLANSVSMASLTAIDISNDLISIAHSRLKNTNMDVMVSDYDELTNAGRSFDLIFSNMSLQWSQNFPYLLEKLYQRLTVDGILAFTIPLVGTFCELQPESRNEYWSHTSILALLKSSGFEYKKTLTQNYLNHYDTPVAALKAIKATGANCLLQKTTRSLQNKHYIDKIYRPIHPSPTLTYQIGFYIVKKG